MVGNERREVREFDEMERGTAMEGMDNRRKASQDKMTIIERERDNFHGPTENETASCKHLHSIVCWAFQTTFWPIFMFY